MSATSNRRVLVVDDMETIHGDFRKILAPETAAEPGLDQVEAALFGSKPTAPRAGFDVDSAYQGQEALAMVRAALATGRPYAMAFVDMRMPPGWDGVETIEHLWQADGQLQVVICTAYTDHSWESVLSRLDMRDRLLILKKPFDAIEVSQLACALTAKWQRTGELEATNRLLVRALRDAEQASRAKSEFIATMSHELRTPMNGVIGSVGVLERSQLSAEQRGLLGMVSVSAGALMEIVDDILDFSNIDAGGVELERRAFSVSTLVAKAQALVAGVAASRGVELSSRVDPTLPRAVWGDAARLRQVLVNLLSNAIKFSSGPGASPRVAIHAREVADAAGARQLEFAVEDNGIGMDAATTARLFTPFLQGDGTATRRFGGTGLGLAIARRLVVLMGGDIGVFSTPLVGSTFTVRLPLEAAPEAMLEPEPAYLSAPPTAPETAAALAPAAVHAGLILVAEDNPINQRVIQAQLKMLGFQAELADDGRQALDRLREGRFALLLTDLQMPEMDGFELAERLRQEPGNLGRMPIIALTANALEGEAARCVAAGMDEYLTKPVHMAGLQASLERWMPVGTSPRQPQPPASPPAGEPIRDRPPVGPVDPDVLPRLVGTDPEVLSEFFRDFAQSAGETETALRAAARDGRSKEVVSAAHRLKGSARSVGATRLGERCAELEAAARATDGAALATSLPLFFVEVAAVREWIASHHAASRV
jgi:two-component system, sensor histidine kinase and response regulator